MTIQFTLTLAVEGLAADGRSTNRAITAAIERGSLTAETLGLTLAEGKAILAELQAAVVDYGNDSCQTLIQERGRLCEFVGFYLFPRLARPCGRNPCHALWRLMTGC